MPEDLGIEVVRLKRRMVDLVGRALGKEEAVVVNFLYSSVEAEEDGAGNFGGIINNLCTQLLVRHPSADNTCRLWAWELTSLARKLKKLQ